MEKNKIKNILNWHINQCQIIHIQEFQNNNFKGKLNTNFPARKFSLCRYLILAANVQTKFCLGRIESKWTRIVK